MECFPGVSFYGKDVLCFLYNIHFPVSVCIPVSSVCETACLKKESDVLLSYPTILVLLSVRMTCPYTAGSTYILSYSLLMTVVLGFLGSFYPGVK